MMELTGIAEETSFKGGTLFYLVFNEGALRVPTTEEGARVVIQHLRSIPVAGEPETGPQQREETGTPESSGDGEDEFGEQA